VGSELLAWTAVAALMTVSPGADMALVARRAIGSSVRDARWAAGGIAAGVLAWGVLSAAGFAALVATSATAYSVLRLAGAAYLVVLGVRALLDARRAWHAGGAHEQHACTVGHHDRSAGRAFRQGMVTNLLNPKVGVFYAAVLPQFLSPGDPVLALSVAMATIHAALSLVWLGAYAWALGRLRGVFARPRVRAALEATTGVVLVALGLRVATTDRPR
jgi:threonine/homoserine/homoserine lactone efflux protein